MSDVHNPRVQFNISKYFEFKYGTELIDIDHRNIEEMNRYVRELDLKTLHAMEAPDEIKRSPFLITIDLVLKELNERQYRG